MRPSREHSTRNEQTYFVTSETWARRQIFRNDRWAKLFVNTLDSYREKVYLLHEFVVMPDHFHVIITPTTSLEKAVQFIKGGFSHRARVELESNMEIWQKGFSDHRIRNAGDYANHVQYIHANPMKAGLCTLASEYEYSSAHSGFELDPVPKRLKPLSGVAVVGAAEAAPFQNASKQAVAAAPEAALFQSGPQGLKPVSSAAGDGTFEAAPLQNSPQGLKPRSSVAAAGAPEGAPFQGKTKRHA